MTVAELEQRLAEQKAVRRAQYARDVDALAKAARGPFWTEDKVDGALCFGSILVLIASLAVR